MSFDSARKIRVLIVDDSFFMKKMLEELLAGDSKIEVVGMANDGQEAIKKARELRPDVITMDFNMPVLNGLQATKEILADQTAGRPAILMISAYTREGSKEALEALRLGAVDFVQKTSGEISFDIDRIKDEILSKVHAAAGARVRTYFPIKEIESKKQASGISAKKIVIIGSSTGGPPVVEDILRALPKDFSANVIIVQHLPKFFISKFAERLNGLSQLAIKEAEQGDKILSGQVLVIPSDQVFSLEKIGTDYFVDLKISKDCGPGPHPSIDCIMSSVAEKNGPDTIGVILTGMGEDGREGVKKIKNNGGYVIAQDPDTATIASMPEAIISANLSDEILPPEKIAQRLVELVS